MGASRRALLIGTASNAVTTVRMRDRLIAAGLPLIVLPLLFRVLSAFLPQPFPPGLSGIIGFFNSTLFVTVPLLPIVVLLSIPIIKRGWIGVLPTLAIGFCLGSAVAFLVNMLGLEETRPAVGEVIVTLIVTGLLGAFFALSLIHI